MDAWRSALVRADATNIWIRGHDIASLMTRTHVRGNAVPAPPRPPSDGRRRTAAQRHPRRRGRLTAPAEPSCAASRIVASGNRQSASAAIAAGVLAIGDEHEGRPPAAWRRSKRLWARRRPSISRSLKPPASTSSASATRGGRCPAWGIAERSKDPRIDVLVDLANQEELAGDGFAAMRALETAVSRLIEPLPLNIDGASRGTCCTTLAFRRPPAT